MDLKSFDWRKYKRYVSPQAADDFNRFLEAMPQNAGQTVLLMAGIAWAAAAGIGLYTTIQVKSLTAMRSDLKENKALQPMVPRLKDVPVAMGDIKNFVDTLSTTYPGLVIKQQGADIAISSKSTAAFAQFRESIGHVQNGGVGWRVSVDKLCVGRECPHDQLTALLKISKVSVDKPE